MSVHHHGGAQRRRPMGGARGRRVELEAVGGQSSKPSVEGGDTSKTCL
jgi:hypothetical protein